LTAETVLGWSDIEAEVEEYPVGHRSRTRKEIWGLVSWETIFGSCSWDSEHDNTRCDIVNPLMLGMQVH